MIGGTAIEPQTGDVVVQTLHALLEDLGLCPPYVLVGHSLGGLFANLFARVYPDETAAVVIEAVRSVFPAATTGNGQQAGADRLPALPTAWSTMANGRG